MTTKVRRQWKIFMSQIEADHSAKAQLWIDFAIQHRLAEESVPLSDLDHDQVNVMPYGRNSRLVLKRSPEMDSLMRALGRQLIQEPTNRKSFTTASST